MKKFSAIALSLLMLVTALALFAGCSNHGLAKKGDGEDYKFSTISDLTSLGDYEYDGDQASFWDYYSVEYDLKVPAVEAHYSVLTSRLARVTSLDKVQAARVKGFMAHSAGIYYVRESALGVTVELLYDTVYNTIAYKVSGLLAKLGAAVAEDETQFEQWVCFNGNEVDSFVVEEALITLNHFYDKKLFDALDGEENIFDNRKNVYTCDNVQAIADMMDFWFDISDSLILDARRASYNVSAVDPGDAGVYTIDSGSVKIDLSKGTSPKVELSLTATYPAVGTTIECGGTLKYSNVDNTALEIPQEVAAEWSNYSDRQF